MPNSKIYHGGALDLAVAKYGGNAASWLDLSTGINPYHYPIENVANLSWTQLPQASALNNLLYAASAAYGCKPQNILAANGTQALIEILPLILPKSKIAILSPTYQEHQHNWQKHGHEVVLVADIEQAKSANHLIIVNPNNPTGKLFSPDELRELQTYFAAKKGYLIIDEAFIDMTPEMSMSAFAGEEGLIILRSFGKFFGLAGVRVGFVLAEDSILNEMGKHIGLWNIAGMSMQIATQALEDLTWQKSMRGKVAENMSNMQSILKDCEFKIVGATDLFCLAEMPNNQSAYDYFEKLAKRHILTRKFIDNNKILRFGLAKTTQQGELAEQLAQTSEEL